MDKFYVCWKLNRKGHKWNTSFDFPTRGGAIAHAYNRMIDILEASKLYTSSADYDKLQRQNYKLRETDGVVQYLGYAFKIVVKVV